MNFLEFVTNIQNGMAGNLFFYIMFCLSHYWASLTSNNPPLPQFYFSNPSSHPLSLRSLIHSYLFAFYCCHTYLYNAIPGTLTAMEMKNMQGPKTGLRQNAKQFNLQKTDEWAKPVLQRHWAVIQGRFHGADLTRHTITFSRPCKTFVEQQNHEGVAAGGHATHT